MNCDKCKKPVSCVESKYGFCGDCWHQENHKRILERMRAEQQYEIWEERRLDLVGKHSE